MRRSPTVLLALGALSLWMAMAAAGCSDDDSPAPDVRVQVERVGLDEAGMPVLLLEERGGPRWLPIWIGDAEAHSIATQIEAVQRRRPNTHDLARRVIDGLRGSVERVVVTDLRAGIYYATITLRADGRRVEIDSRPSDAVAIALRADAPIFVREPLLSPAPRTVDGAIAERPSI